MTPDVPNEPKYMPPAKCCTLNYWIDSIQLLDQIQSKHGLRPLPSGPEEWCWTENLGMAWVLIQWVSV